MSIIWTEGQASIHLHTEDKDNPFMEFVSAKGTRGALNIRVLAEAHQGTIVGKALQEFLTDLRQSGNHV